MSCQDHLSLSRIASRNADEHMSSGKFADARTSLLVALDHALLALHELPPIKVESLGSGVHRIHCSGVGFADVEEDYWQGSWTVTVLSTNVADQAALDDMLRQFRVAEGMD